MHRLGLIAAACGLALAVSGCGLVEDVRTVIGAKRQDDPLATKNPPLSIPPDYALRPPKTSPDRARTDQTTRKARTVLQAKTTTPTAATPSRTGDRSAGESELLRQAGLRRTTSGVVRKVVDIETQSAKKAERAFVDKLVKYKPGAEAEGDKKARSAAPSAPSIGREN